MGCEWWWGWVWVKGEVKGTGVRGFRRERKTPAPWNSYSRSNTEKLFDPNTLSHKYHHHGEAVCPSYSVDSMDLPALTHGWPSKGVDQGR